ncbi:D-2-hydroxyacid dehydrogenase [Nakamurella sp. PAMC28650]|uniref:D-2-hydroxyacid dehydrogenase n=1 Tax=Nakamurella sp. PAMC28650 TaxID=2762325 RepID=UPI00164E8EC3|nr:D-2-hydroxyacid dehydrogenase [Nakamurella sp. PAMC28650]QNK79554.1 D-2-hydroxyacid dehydrogenase [Nakamurella sp. PAMC28650]
MNLPSTAPPPASSDPVTVVLATPLAPDLRHLITDVDPRVALLVDDELLPPQRFPGDHSGDPAYRRTPGQQAAFEALLARADVLYGIPDVDPTMLARTVTTNPGLRWVQTMAAGGGATVQAANLSEEDLARVVFTTSAGVHGGTLAEFALFGVLAAAKDLPRLQRLQRAHEWPERWAMGQVGEQTVLVVGLGGIGGETARLLKCFGATVLGVKRTAGPVDHVDEVHPLSALPELVGRADAIIFTLPGTAATAGLYDAELIAATKPGAVIVNVGRGTVIDEPALIHGLTTGPLGSAYLDVTAVEPLPAESPLWDLPNVVIAPHTAALNAKEDQRIAELFAGNMTMFLAGRRMTNVVTPGEFY